MTQHHDKAKARLEVHGPLALVSSERIGSLVEERPSVRHHRHRSDAGKLQYAGKETRLALDDFSARRGTEQDGDIVHRGALRLYWAVDDWRAAAEKTHVKTLHRSGGSRIGSFPALCDTDTND
ncbi:hypothetical protein CEP54_006006 [Fusarium duplospermum]|uniref:Uncharacterized protein n=1 Tax=Fusarium duplospermum TaxID=1325734 RepID=A0A428Q9J5_9HYPO|nr:hypothetical protein CEP54_006006 [Fusarium duplospermum]